MGRRSTSQTWHKDLAPLLMSASVIVALSGVRTGAEQADRFGPADLSSR